MGKMQGTFDMGWMVDLQTARLSLISASRTVALVPTLEAAGVLEKEF